MCILAPRIPDAAHSWGGNSVAVVVDVEAVRAAVREAEAHASPLAVSDDLAAGILALMAGGEPEWPGSARREPVGPTVPTVHPSPVTA